MTSRRDISSSSSRARAALRRVHRQGNPEGLSRILRRVRPEPVRPLHRLCRRLDRGPGLQGRRHRPAVRPPGARQRALQDREAGRHRQPEGFPQRGRQVRAALPRANEGKNPSWTAYEKIRAVIEKRMFTQVEDLLPVISFESKKDNEDREAARRVRRAHAVARLHAASGPPARRVVHARQQGGVTAKRSAGA